MSELPHCAVALLVGKTLTRSGRKFAHLGLRHVRHLATELAGHVLGDGEESLLFFAHGWHLYLHWDLFGLTGFPCDTERLDILEDLLTTLHELLVGVVLDLG